MSEITPEHMGVAAGVLAALVSIVALWDKLRVWHWLQVAWRGTFGRTHAKLSSQLDDVNLFGIAIFWPLKKIPIYLAVKLSEAAHKSKLVPFVFIVTVFFLIPGLIIFLMR